MLYSLAGLLAAGTAVLAQQTLWGQCGGIGWTGPTTCESNAHCELYNDWYHQCIPGAPPATSTSTTRPPTSTTTQTSSQPTSTSNPNPNPGSAPSTSGTLFTVDGVAGYYTGTNCYPCTESLDASAMDTALSHMAADGLTLLRVWGFNDVNTNPGGGAVWFQLLSASGSQINTGANGLQRVDAVVASAERHGLKLIIPFVNNWDDYGGMNAYVAAFGGSKTGWYTNQAAQAQYRTYVETVVNRYKDSPAIFAWELANEPRCQGCSTDVIYDWAKSTSEFVKSLDPAHMVTLGDEGFGLPGGTSYPYTTYEGVDFVKNLEIDTLDFGTFHLYPGPWGMSDSDGNGWVEAHAAACAAAGKPCFFEEYGTESNKCTIMTEWQETAESADGVAADAFWQYGDTSSWHNDGHTVYRGSSEYQCLILDRDV